MKIYLAKSISNESYDNILNYLERTMRELKVMGYEVFHPMIGKKSLRNEVKIKSVGYKEEPVATNHAIVERDEWMIDMVDIIYANLIGKEEPSFGTVMELAWAHSKGKHTVLVMEDGNLHEHAFVLECADIIFKTHEEAMNYLEELNHQCH